METKICFVFHEKSGRKSSLSWKLSDASSFCSLFIEDADFFLCVLGDTGRKRSMDLTRKNASGSATCQMSVIEARTATKASAVVEIVKRELARIQIV
jgi:hypothetical protein